MAVVKRLIGVETERVGDSDDFKSVGNRFAEDSKGMYQNETASRENAIDQQLINSEERATAIYRKQVSTLFYYQ